VGDVWQTLEPETTYDSSAWILEHFIKGPDDYRVMEYVYRDAVFYDNYDYLHEARRRVGGDGLVYVRIAKVPIQEMLYQMMGLERFSFDYHDRRDLFHSLHHTMLERYQEMFDLAVGAPVEILLFGDNISSDVVGDERFRNYCMPIYKSLRERLVGTNKMLAVHMDGRLATLKDATAEAEFDIVEALTPPPMGDVSIREARQSWPDKALWINFTSSIHIEPADVIEAHTRQLLEEAGSKRGFAIGVTEDVPVEALEKSLDVILRVIKEHG
jgi:uroporphyrinogen-III decarboxylase